jgi:8-oxo-dGTP diphosphatase
MKKIYPAGSLDNIGFVSIYAKHKGKWIFCFHKRRKTWECPGGHVEPGEDPLGAAKRELFEETGALNYKIIPLWDYHFPEGNHNGRVYFADVVSFGELPQSEMERIGLFDQLPENVTYDRISMQTNLDLVDKKIREYESSSEH